ncbi:MAG: NAD(P)-binding domain-containing protein [Bacteroidota bacterium]
MSKVCVIGAGPSGVTAAKNLIDAGLDVTIYEKNDEVGGNWVYNSKTGHSSVFKTTHIISSKKLSEYADYPMPEDYPDYPSHEQLAAYFQNYAKHFGFYDTIQFDSEIVDAQPTADGKWEVAVRKNGMDTSHVYDQFVVCNGHHWNPRMPEYPGQFSGEFIHSHDFKTSDQFKNKRVLVIGGGNSACDVAVETSRVSEYTHLSWRRGYWIVPKFLLGKPSDATGEKLSFVPTKLKVKGFEWLLNFLQGKNEDIGLQKPDHDIFETHPTINSELYYFVRHGKIAPKMDIERFEGDTVVFKDGSKEEYDVIVACTGFKITHPFFNKHLIDYSEGDVPLYLKMMHPRFDSLYFVGLFQPLGCIWPLAELQSKIVAREIRGEWKRPDDMELAIKKELENPDYKQLKSPRHTVTVDYHAFRKRLLKELPKDYVQKEPRIFEKSYEH